VNTLKTIAIASFYSLAMLPLASCGEGGSGAASSTAGKAEDHGHDHADHDHDHDHAAPAAAEDAGHAHGATTQLGEQELGGYKIKASRDGDVKAGGDVPIDVWVTGGAKIASVRFWIGTEDAKGTPTPRSPTRSRPTPSSGSRSRRKAAPRPSPASRSESVPRMCRAPTAHLPGRPGRCAALFRRCGTSTSA
jgi:hypothetical protein